MLIYQYFYRFHHVSTHQDDKISSILLYLSFQITLKYVPGCLTNKYLSCTSSWPYGPTSFEHEQPDPPPLRPWPIFTTPTTKSCGRNSIDEHRTVIVKLPVIAFSDSDNEILKRWHRISEMMGWVVTGREGPKLTMVKGHWGSSEHSVKEGEIHFVQCPLSVRWY